MINTLWEYRRDKALVYVVGLAGVKTWWAINLTTGVKDAYWLDETGGWLRDIATFDYLEPVSF